MNYIPPIALATALLLATPALGAAAPPPAAPRDIVATAGAAGSFKVLGKALEAAGLVDTLRGPGPFTVFAPTDEAFGKVPTETLASLLAPAGREQLKAILLHHVIAGRVTSKDLLPSASATTVGGTPLEFGLRVGPARVLTADVLCSNGVIHVIDQVLIPPAAPSAKPVSASDLIRDAIGRGAPLYNQGHVDACVAIYEETAASLLRLPEEGLAAHAREDLTRTLASKASDPSARAWDLRRAFDRILNDEGFEPLLEAPLPAGFPGPGPVNQVVEKQYPAYRAARAQGGNSFWTLFRHIQKNDIKMTAPVEMTMDGGMKAMDMAFLYESAKQGAPGADGAVSVMDLPATTVLSMGMRGASDDQAIARAKAAIESRMKADGYRAAGAWRLLGYNSPMVPAARRFWELQVPVAR